jgi:hypothetical protein
MIRLAITQAAFDAIAGTMPLGTVGAATTSALSPRSVG